MSRLSPVSWLWEHSKEGRDYINITHPRLTLVPPAALAICLGAGAVLPGILQQPSEIIIEGRFLRIFADWVKSGLNQ